MGIEDSFGQPPVKSQKSGVETYEPLQTTNIANETTERLVELLAQWKRLAESKGGDSGKAKIDLIEKELKHRQDN